MSEPRVVLYTAAYCGYCWRAKALLDKLGIPYRNIDITVNFAERKRLIQETGHRTVPNIQIDGRCIGGSDELQALARAGQLEHLRTSAA